MHHPTDRIAHATAFVTPVVEQWLEQEICSWKTLLMMEALTNEMVRCSLIYIHSKIHEKKIAPYQTTTSSFHGYCRNFINQNSSQLAPPPPHLSLSLTHTRARARMHTYTSPYISFSICYSLSFAFLFRSLSSHFYLRHLLRLQSKTLIHTAKNLQKKHPNPLTQPISSKYPPSSIEQRAV